MRHCKHTDLHEWTAISDVEYAKIKAQIHYPYETTQFQRIQVFDREHVAIWTDGSQKRDSQQRTTETAE